MASLLPSATEIVCALGARPSLVGVSHECDHPADVVGLPVLTRSHVRSLAGSAEIDRDVRELVRDVLAVYELDLDALRAAAPDVIVTQDLCDVCAVAYDDVCRAVRELWGAHVEVVNLHPTRLRDVLADVGRVGAALGRESEARAVVASIERRIEAVRERGEEAVRRAGRPRVLTVEWLDPVMVGGTWMPELVRLAGGEPLVTSPGDHAPTLGADQLAALAPEVVLVKPCGFDLARTRSELGATALLAPGGPAAGWPAVRAGRVFAADGNAFFNRPGPRLAESLEILAACVHPDAFEDFAVTHRRHFRPADGLERPQEPPRRSTMEGAPRRRASSRVPAAPPPLETAPMTSRALDELPPAIADADNLPSVPGVALAVLRLAKDENAGIDEFADAIARDPALAAKLLKVANSPLFSMAQDVATLQQATMVLGLKTVQLMSLSFSLTSSLPQTGAVGSFRFSEYWRRSLVTSVAARSFCKLLSKDVGDEAFLCGLLSHIGQLVMVQCMPEEYEAVLEASPEWPDLATETRLLGFDHAAVGGALLASWDLPEIISTVVTHMHVPDGLSEDADERVRELCWVMRMASLTEQVLCNDEKGAPLAELREVATRRRVPSDHLEGFLIGLESGIRETAELLDVDLGDDRDHAVIVAQAREQLVQIGLGTAARLRQEERRSQHLENENRELAEVAATDKLTGIANRAGFDHVIEKEIEARIEGDEPHALGVLLIDVDRFKRFNDTHGHKAGDRVLRIVGGVLEKLTRQSDLPARYGGEEFAVIVPQTTPGGLRNYAERIRKTIEGVPLPLPDGSTATITVSIGGACLARAGSPADADRLVELADEHLYQCKEGGRNCTAVALTVLDLRA